MTLKGDAKFKEKLTCDLKNYLRNSVNFHAGSWMSRNLNLDWLFLPKVYKDLDEKVQKSYVLWQWRVMQSLKRKMTLGSKNHMRNLVNFNASSGKSENLHFDVLLYSTAYKVSAKKVQNAEKEWSLMTLKKDPNFGEKLTFFFEKWHEEFGEF